MSDVVRAKLKHYAALEQVASYQVDIACEEDKYEAILARINRDGKQKQMAVVGLW